MTAIIVNILYMVAVGVWAYFIEKRNTLTAKGLYTFLVCLWLAVVSLIYVLHEVATMLMLSGWQP